MGVIAILLCRYIVCENLIAESYTLHVMLLLVIIFSRVADE